MKKTEIILFIFLIGCSAREAISIKNDAPVQTYNLCYSVEECVVSINRKIEKFWRISVDTEDIETVVILGITDKGEVSKFVIKKSSGDEKFDASIQNAVYKASPFSELEGLTKRDLEKFSDVKLVFKK